MSGGSVKPNALALKDFAAKEIADGVLTVDQTYIVVQAQAGVTDDLDTMTPDFNSLSVNGTDYGPLVILVADAGDTITLKHSAAANGFDLPDDTDYPLKDDSLIIAVFNYADSLWRIAGADTSPTITDFTDAQHDHADAAGGGNTLTIPTIADFTNATHDHADAAGGGNTLTIPTIADFTNATHDHEDAAGGGQITPADSFDAAVPITLGGTGQAAKEAAFDALSPVTTEGDVVFRNATVNTRLAIGAATEVLTVNAGATAPEWSAAIGGLFESYVHLSDEKAQNTDGGTLTQGAMRTRDLNTETDPDGICTLAANQFTLDAGTYFAIGSVPGMQCENHQAQLYNATGAAVLILGTSEISDAAAEDAQTRSVITGAFTVAAGQALELQQQCITTRATTGMGNAANITTEVYSEISIWKVG